MVPLFFCALPGNTTFFAMHEYAVSGQSPEFIYEFGVNEITTFAIGCLQIASKASY